MQLTPVMIEAIRLWLASIPPDSATKTGQVSVPAGWTHDCAVLLTNDVELWIDSCPHCGRARPATSVALHCEQCNSHETISSVTEQDLLYNSHVCNEFEKWLDQNHWVSSGHECARAAWFACFELFGNTKQMSVPAGCKLVPIEPTSKTKAVDGGVGQQGHDFAHRTYSVMLAAAPEVKP